MVACAKVLCLLLLPSLVASKRGFILTSTFGLRENTQATFYLTLYDVPDTGSIVLTLEQRSLPNEDYEDSVRPTSPPKVITLQSVTQAVSKPSPSGGQTFNILMFIPDVQSNIGGTYLTVEGKLGQYSFKKETPIQLVTGSYIMFIETDKPIYKPGQLVRIRTLTVDNNLIPIVGKPGLSLDIWIESPSGIRLAQWLGLSFQKAMEQVEMQLSDYTELGQWIVYTQINNGNETLTTQNTFQVAEYVLPKFEVTVTPPPFALANADSITWQICAKYTYGQPVKGNLTIIAGYGDLNFNPYERNYDYGQNLPRIVHSEMIEGCTNFTVLQNELKWLQYSGYQQSLLALVTEDGTDVEFNNSATISLSSVPLNLAFTNQYGYFKPGIPFFGQVSVTNPDGTPKVSELVELCAVYTIETLNPSHRIDDTGLVCNNYTSDEKGTFLYTVPPISENVINIQLQMNAVDIPTVYDANNNTLISQPTESAQLSPWYSPSKQFLQIQPLYESIPCGETRDLTVYFTGNKGDQINLNIQVISKGAILSEKTTAIDFSQSQANLVPDKTYIAKSLSSENAMPAALPPLLGKTTITVTADYTTSPSAYVLVYFARSDGEIIAGSTSLDIDQCLKNKVEMKFLSEEARPGTDVGVQVKASPQSLCGIAAVDKSVYLLSSSNLLSLNDVFSSVSNDYGYPYDSQDCITENDPGFPSDLIATEYNNYADSFSAFQDGNLLVVTDLTVITKPCPLTNRNNYGEYGQNGAGSDKYYPPGGARVPSPAAVPDFGGAGSHSGSGGQTPPVRSNFPETWLWEMDSTDANGVFTAQRTLPDTITDWVGSAVCLHPQDGLGVSQTTDVTAFLPFFVSATLPYSVIRGEITPVIITVFNYLAGGCLPITLKLDEDKSFTVTSGSLSENLCVCGGDSATYKYLVKPLTVGTLNFTIQGTTSSDNSACAGKPLGNSTAAQDAAIVSIIVNAEGFKQQETFSDFACPSQDQGKFSASYNLSTPQDTVDGSVRAEFLVTGDILGPALQNLDNLVGKPYGCGEQNMLNFAPDVYILDFLTKSGNLKDDIKQRLLQYLQTGYQHELAFRHYDGSYSAFGNQDSSGSIWLTAFVVKTFAGASKYIFVDKSDLSISVAWIQAQQDTDSGCFPEVGQLFNKAMEGGSGSNLGSKATLTSYILIALLEAQVSVDPANVQKAQSCLAKEGNPTIYTLALMTYASCLSKDPQAQNRLADLMKLRKTQDGLDYWLDDSTNSKAIQIETASYAILSLLSCGGQDNKAKALPVVRWISKQMNAYGGFVSTQDTVMALQALSAYASTIDKSPVNINISMTAGSITKTFTVDENNKYLVQTIDLTEGLTTVNVEAFGSGCSLIQTNLYYNSPIPPNFEALNLAITPIGVGKDNCRKAQLTFCMSYNYQGQFSNMAVLDLKLPSGYDVETGSLDELFGIENLYFKKYSVNGNEVILYFAKIGPGKQCYSILADQTFEVENLKPATASLYDYYNPAQQISQSYKINNTCI